MQHPRSVAPLPAVDNRQPLQQTAILPLPQTLTIDSPHLTAMESYQYAGNPIQRKETSPKALGAHGPLPGASQKATGLPDNLRQGIENLSGISMDNVAVHYNSSQPAQLNALAYAQGRDIHLGPGQDHHLPHEAWHVVQQAQGRVAPTMQMKGGRRINDNEGLEREADAMGQKALQMPVQMRDARPELTSFDASMAMDGNSGAVAQRKLMIGKRDIHRSTLFSGSAFKNRLTGWIDKRIGASSFSLTRDDVRSELAKMIDDGAHQYTYRDTHAAVEAAIVKATETVYGNIDASLIFGMDGRSSKQMETAIEVGYRNFDCAQSYGNTTLLEQAIADSGVSRDAFKVCYKFDIEGNESAIDLKRRLSVVAAQFGPALNSLVLHNLDAPKALIQQAWQVLNAMKIEGAVTEIGVGNVGAKDGALLSDLEAIGPIDVVENSISSLLASPGIAEMIQKSHAKVHFYDVIKTADEVGVNSEAGIKALIATIASEHGQFATAIMSSSNMQRQSRNIRKFGDGSTLQEINWLNPAEAAAATRIYAWRQEAQDGQGCNVDDLDFVLPETVRAWMQGLSEDAGVDMRNRIKEAAAAEDVAVTDNFIQSWIALNGGPTALQQRQGVPARMGLKKRYLGMSLAKVLSAFLGTNSCYWKWSLPLVQLMIYSADDWNAFLHFGANEIVVE